MTEVEEDRFVCLACQARHFPAVYSSRRALRIHRDIAKSKNPKCAQEWGKIKVITRPGDVIAGGAGGMGPCHPPQHQPSGGEYTYTILCIYPGYTMYISHKYTIYVPSIYHGYTKHIQCIDVVYTKDIPYSIFNE